MSPGRVQGSLNITIIILMALLPWWYIKYKQERLKPSDTDEMQMRGWCLYCRNTNKKWKLTEEIIQGLSPGTAFKFAQGRKLWNRGRMGVSSTCGFMNLRPWNQGSFWGNFYVLSCARYYLGKFLYSIFLEEVHCISVPRAFQCSFQLC